MILGCKKQRELSNRIELVTIPTRDQDCLSPGHALQASSHHDRVCLRALPLPGLAPICPLLSPHSPATEELWHDLHQDHDLPPGSPVVRLLHQLHGHLPPVPDGGGHSPLVIIIVMDSSFLPRVHLLLDPIISTSVIFPANGSNAGDSENTTRGGGGAATSQGKSEAVQCGKNIKGDLVNFYCNLQPIGGRQMRLDEMWGQNNQQNQPRQAVQPSPVMIQVCILIVDKRESFGVKLVWE